MVSYFFILGNNPSLSVAEILNKFQPEKYSLIEKQVLRVDFVEKIDEQRVIKKLGGVIKIVELMEEVSIEKPPRSLATASLSQKKEEERTPPFSPSLGKGEERKKVFKNSFDKKTEISEEKGLFELIKKYLPEEFDEKYKFGFSFYGNREVGLKKIAMDVKRELKDRKISCRWIICKGNNLSSVVVAKNKLIDRGREFVVVFGNGKKYLGIAKAVQDFEELSFRDYNRPARDSQSGMIPPKLAQMMLNIGIQGRTSKVLLDPFCGSGTMLMEAMLLGVRDVIGSDVSDKAVKNTQKNLEWIQERSNLTRKNLFEVRVRDVSRLSRFVKKESIDVIVTEPYLGPQKKVRNIEKVKKDLEILYTQAIVEFRKVLKNDGRVVMVWPFLRGAKNGFINPEIRGFKMVNQIPDDLNVKLTERETIIYGRKGQRVWREIVVMIKE